MISTSDPGQRDASSPFRLLTAAELIRSQPVATKTTLVGKRVGVRADDARRLFVEWWKGNELISSR